MSAQPTFVADYHLFGLGVGTRYDVHLWRADAGMSGDGLPLYRFYFTGEAPRDLAVFSSGGDFVFTEFNYGAFLDFPTLGSVRLWGWNLADFQAGLPYNYTSADVGGGPLNLERIPNPVALHGSSSYKGCGRNHEPGSCDQDVITFIAEPRLVTPEPGTWALLGTGLVGVAALARRKRTV